VLLYVTLHTQKHQSAHLTDSLLQRLDVGRDAMLHYTLSHISQLTSLRACFSDWT